MSDGKIIIDTDVDSSGAEKGIEKTEKAISNKTSNISSDFEKMSSSSEKQVENATKSVESNVGKMTDSVEKNLEQIHQTSEETGTSSAESLNKSFSGIGDIAKKGAMAAAASIAGIGTAIGGVSGYALKLGQDYEKAMSKLAVQTEATNEDMAQFKDIVKNIYGDNFGESFDDVASSLATVRTNLWLSGQELQNTTEYALGFRDAFGVDVNESTRAAKSLMDSFGISSKEAFNMLVQGEQNGLNYSDEFIDSISEYSVQFKKLGFNVEDMFSIFQSGTEAGAFNLDKIGDAVKEFSIRAIDGSQTTQQGFQLLGMSATDTAKKFAVGGDTAKETFNQVIQGLANMKDPVQQSTAGVDLFGTMWEDLGPKVVTSLSTANDYFDKTRDSADQINKIQYNTFGDALQGLKRQIETNLLLPISDNCLPALNDMANKMQEAFKSDDVQASLSQLQDNIGNLITKVADLAENNLPKIIDAFSWIVDNAGTIIPILAGIAIGLEALNVASQIMTVVTAMKELGIATKIAEVAQAAFNLVMDANPISLIIIAIAALVAGILYLWNTNEGFRNTVIAAWNEIGQVASVVWGAIVNFFTVTIPAAFNAVIDWFKNNWMELLLFIVNPFAGAFALLYNNCDGFRNFVDGFIQSVIDFFVNGWNSIVNFFTVSVPQWIASLVAFFVNGWNSIVNFFTVSVPQWIASLVAWFNSLPAQIGYALGFLLGTIVQWGVNTWNYLITNVPLWISGIVNWFAQLPGQIWNWLLNNINDITNWGNSVYNTATSFASNTINGIINFFAQLPGQIWNWLLNSINDIANWGNNVYNTATSFASNTINGIINFFSQLPGQMWNYLSNAISSVANWGANMVSTGVSAAGNLVSGIVNTITSLPGQMLDIGTNIVHGIWNGIINAKDWILGQIGGFASGIVDGFKDALGIHSPSRVMRDSIGKYIPQGIGVGIEDEMPDLQDNINSQVSDLTARLQTTVDYETAKTTAGVVLQKNIGTSDSANSTNDVPDGSTFIVKNYMDSDEISEYTYKKVDGKFAIAGKRVR